MSRIISVSDEIQQFRRNLTKSRSVAHGDKPKLVANRLEKTVDNDCKINHGPKLQCLDKKQCQMDCTLSSHTINTSKMADIKTSNPTKASDQKGSDTSTKENACVPSHQESSKAILNDVSDNPSAPIYPPRENEIKVEHK